MPSPRRWIWPWGHAYAVLLPVLLILVACSGSQPLGTGPEPPVDTTDTLVLWGGFGYLDRRAQPQLDKLLFESGRDESLGIMLRDEVAGRVLLPAWSAHPVVADEASYDVFMQGRRGPGPRSADEFHADTAGGVKLLALSVIGTLEFVARIPRATTAGQLYQDGWVVTVAATLSRPGSGEVLATRTATTQRLEIGGEAKAADLRQDYATTARRALQELAKAPQTSRHGNMAMVVSVGMGGPRASRLHEYSSNLGPACPMKDPCPVSATTGRPTPCRVLQAMLAELATQHLAAQGQPMLPPFAWAVWADYGSDELELTTRTLELPTTGGVFSRTKPLLIRLEPEVAQTKVAVTLDDIALEEQESTPLTRARLYRPAIRLDGFTDLACTAQSESFPVKTKPMRWALLKSIKDVPAELDRLLDIGAVNQTLAGDLPES